MAKRLIGLDVGTWSIKAAYVDAKDASIRSWDSEQIVFPDAEADQDATTNVRPIPEADTPEAAEGIEGPAEIAEPWLDALSRLIDRMALDEDAIAIGLPGTHAVTLQVDVPFAERSKAASVLPHLLMDRLPVGINEVVWDFQMQANGDQNEAYVGFSKKSVVRDFLAQLKSVGVDPQRLLVPENALSFALRASGQMTENVALLDIGHEHTRIVVQGTNRVALARTIKIAGKNITQAIAKMFKVPADEAERIKHQYAAVVSASDAPNDQMKLMSDAVVSVGRNLVREVRRSLQGLYASDRIEVATIYITGGTAAIRGLDRYLEGELGIPVKRLKQPHEGSAVANGLLLSHDEKFNSSILNLRQGDFSYRGRSAFVRRQMFIFAAAAALLIGALGLVLILQKQAYEARRDAMRATLQTQTMSVFGQKLTKKKDIERIIGGGESEIASFVPKISAFELMHMITTKVSPDIEMKLSRFEVDIDRKVIQIMGETTDAQAVDRIVSDLEAIECLKSIKKDKLKVKTDGKADFELQIASECS